MFEGRDKAEVPLCFPYMLCRTCGFMPFDCAGSNRSSPLGCLWSLSAIGSLATQWSFKLDLPVVVGNDLMSDRSGKIRHWCGAFGVRVLYHMSLEAKDRICMLLVGAGLLLFVAKFLHCCLLERD
nr:hypothetical protein Iba_chr02aCG8240 [Ipomoea batatas]